MHFLCLLSLLFPTLRDTQRMSPQVPSSSASPVSPSWRPSSYGVSLPNFSVLFHCVSPGAVVTEPRLHSVLLPKCPHLFLSSILLFRQRDLGSAESLMWAEAGPYSPESPRFSGHMLEKQTPMGMCLMGAGDMILSPKCSCPSGLVDA